MEKTQKNEGAKITFKQVTEIQPWDKFAAECDIPEIKGSAGNIPKETVAAIGKAFYDFCQTQNPIIGSCLICARRFKQSPKKKENAD